VGVEPEIETGQVPAGRIFWNQGQRVVHGRKNIRRRGRF
jgi:hypothetical protein